jgi:Na+/H+ antiporter NhaD/arsenite permease-like protein
MNFITAPLIADLFLLAISAVGRKEVYDSTIGLGADSFSAIEIVAFFITLAYITISIDASGLIRYLSFCMLRWGDGSGSRLFIYLNTFFFGLGSIIGDDTAIMSCATFLAYMTRVSSNIIHPRAWIHTQFAIVKISSTIMVSSNPTNLILVGAFNIKFIRYTANVVVPVVVTAIVLFPFLFYVVFADESLIPWKVQIHMLTPEEKAKTPVNLNIPDARGVDEERDGIAKILSLAEIMNPFLDPKGAAFGVLIVTATLVIILVMNSQSTGQHPVYWVTLPAAFVMFCWDITSGWVNRHETREIARKGRREKELFRTEQTLIEEAQVGGQAMPEPEERHTGVFVLEIDEDLIMSSNRLREDEDEDEDKDEKQEAERGNEEVDEEPEMEQWQRDDMARREQLSREVALRLRRRKITLADLITDLYRWSQETFPTAMAVLTHLPFALVPFIFSMFLLVQALVTRCWVLVFAYGWDHWVNKTGTVGAVGGMGFVSIILCNVSFHLAHP